MDLIFIIILGSFLVDIILQRVYNWASWEVSHNYPSKKARAVLNILKRFYQ